MFYIRFFSEFEINSSRNYIFDFILLQLRRIPVSEADEHELEFEAKWIYQYAFDNATLSEQVLIYF